MKKILLALAFAVHIHAAGIPVVDAAANSQLVVQGLKQVEEMVNTAKRWTDTVAHYKQQIALKFADLVYNGQWFTPLREALSAFVDKTQETVTGEVKLKLYKGNIINAGVTSPYSLYDEDIATFDEDEVYNQNDSAGFINLFGLPIKVKAQMELKNKK